MTAARHDDLLEKLKAAESDEEKAEAAEALKTNYTEHYAIETWWREQKLAELEERLKEMAAQVQQRQEAEEKYVEAAMTIAQLWADGITLAPPKPGRATDYGKTPIPADSAPTLPSPGPAFGAQQPSQLRGLRAGIFPEHIGLVYGLRAVLDV